MKKLTFIAVIAMMAMAACTGKQTSASDGSNDSNDSLSNALLDTGIVDWDSTSLPIYIITDDELTLHVPSSLDDSASVMPLAKTYKHFVCPRGTAKMQYTGFREGYTEFGNIVSLRYEPGFSFTLDKKFGKADEEYVYVRGIGFNDKFMSTHETIPFHATNVWDNPDEVNKGVPASLAKTLEERYGGKIASSTFSGNSDDGKISIYSVQFVPKDTVCLAMRVVTCDDSLYVLEEPTQMYDGEFTWHVDDGGEYSILDPIAITRGKKGVDIFYVEAAPECTSVCALLLRGNKIHKEYLHIYYNYADFRPEVRLANEVDLGLSVNWATCNVGAKTEEKYGTFFAWGETAAKKAYTEQNSKFADSSIDKLYKLGVIDRKGRLTPKYDAATAVMGDKWRTPTREEWEELMSNCTWKLVQRPSDIRGYEITSYNGATIFLPTNGYVDDEGNNRDFGFYGNYWASTANGIYADCFRFSVPDERTWTDKVTREIGYCVRAVRKY